MQNQNSSSIIWSQNSANGNVGFEGIFVIENENIVIEKISQSQNKILLLIHVYFQYV